MAINLFDSEYNVIKTIGKGSYGLVVQAKKRDDDQNCVAIKVSKFPETFDEVQFLRKFDHENIIKMIDCLEMRRYSDKKTSYQIEMVMELCYCNLDFFNKMHLRQLPFKSAEIMKIMQQVISGVIYLRDEGVAHCDLKPDNILLTQSKAIKICDFGLSQYIKPGQPNSLYVQAVNYAAPEVLIKNEYYDFKIDIWSIGCIMVELYTGVPLFNCCEREQQFSNIAKICGGFSKGYIRHIQKMYPQLTFVSQPKRCLKEAISEKIDNQNAVRLIDDMLRMDPFKRPSAKNILKHRFFHTQKKI